MRDVDQVWQVNNIPRDLIVVGAGVIGLEYASMQTALGIRVTIIDQRPNRLDFVDQEIVEALSYHLRPTPESFFSLRVRSLRESASV